MSQRVELHDVKLHHRDDITDLVCGLQIAYWLCLFVPFCSVDPQTVNKERTGKLLFEYRALNVIAVA